MALTATIKTKIGSTQDWNAVTLDADGNPLEHPRILNRGELGIEITNVDENNLLTQQSQMLIKVGDGIRAFNDLPYINSYDTMFSAMRELQTRVETAFESTATPEQNGLMSKEDKYKLDNIFQVWLDDSLSPISTNGVENQVIYFAFEDIKDALMNKVDTIRTINGHALTSDVILSPEDLGIDLLGTSNDILNDAKMYTDTRVTSLANSTIEGFNSLTDSINTAFNNTIAYATEYTDTNINSAKESLLTDIYAKIEETDYTTRLYLDTQDAETLNSANSYTDTCISNLQDIMEQADTTLNEYINSQIQDTRDYITNSFNTLMGSEDIDETLDTIKEIDDFITHNKNDIETLDNIVKSNKTELLDLISSELFTVNSKIDENYNTLDEKIDENINFIDDKYDNITKELKQDLLKNDSDNFNALTVNINEINNGLNDKINLINENLRNNASSNLDYIEDNYYFRGKTTINEIVDWNSLYNPQEYYIKLSNEGMSETYNAPAGESGEGILIVHRKINNSDENGESIVQIYMPKIPNLSPLWIRVADHGVPSSEIITLVDENNQPILDEDGNPKKQEVVTLTNLSYKPWERFISFHNTMVDINIVGDVVTTTYGDGHVEVNGITHPEFRPNEFNIEISLNDNDKYIYNGSEKVEMLITPASINASHEDHLHDERYLRVVGGSLTNNLSFFSNNIGFNWDTAALNSSIINSLDEETGDSHLEMNTSSKLEDGDSDIVFKVKNQKILDVNKNGINLVTGKKLYGIATHSEKADQADILYQNANPNKLNANYLQYFNINTSTTSGAGVNAAPSDVYYHVLRMCQADANNNFVDIAVPSNTSSAMAYRNIVNNEDKGWRYILDNTNTDIYENKIQVKHNDNLVLNKTIYTVSNGIVVNYDSTTHVGDIQLEQLTEGSTVYTAAESNKILLFGDKFNVTNIAYDKYGRIIDNDTNLKELTLPSYTASDSVNGLMSKDDKVKLDKILITDDGTPQPATATTLGGIKVGETLTITDDGILEVNFDKMNFLQDLHISDNEPASTKVLWIDTSDGGTLKYYNGTEWISIKTRRAGDAITTILEVSKWNTLNNTYEIEVRGINDESYGNISIPPISTLEERQAIRDANLYVSYVYNNIVTITADGVIPTFDIPIEIVFM